ncbi:hypothetical protein BT69DRAFT_1328645 [Atractiella rhizophila]|nr:hypothetical protein BT69DRAFT_1328645 [Atractiella rhizophila]
MEEKKEALQARQDVEVEDGKEELEDSDGVTKEVGGTGGCDKFNAREMEREEGVNATLERIGDAGGRCFGRAPTDVTCVTSF